MVLLAAPLWAQERTGLVSGRVTDPAGLPVGGAAVKAVQLETRLERVALTSEQDGSYTLPLLPPGVYRLEASRQGFRSAAQEGVTVRLSQPARVDLQLGLATASESVTVVADSAQVNTVNSNGGAVVESRAIEELPLNGRNFIQLAALAPGAVQTPSRFEVQGIQAARNGVSVNGLRTQSNAFLLDGMTNTDPNFNGYVVTPPPDALDQFKIITGSFAAEYGSSAGSTVSALTRAGGNQFHGRAWNFLRNDALDARDFFALSRPPLRQNQYGGTLGGRLVRDRAFFFGYYEGLRARTGTTQNVVVPTEAQRAGNLTGLTPPPRDPAAGNLPFPGALLPASRISPIATRLQQNLVPLPNTGANRFVRSPSVATDGEQWGGRIDQRFGDNHLLFARYAGSKSETANPLGAGTFSPAGSDSTDDAHSAVLSHTWTVSPTRLNEATVSFLRLFSRPATWSGEKLGDYGWLYPGTEATAQGLPLVSITGLFSVGDVAQSWTQLARNTWQAGDNFTWLRGRHSFKMGGEWRYQQIYLIFPNRPNGDFSMTGALSANAYADFLLGLPAQFRQGGGQPAKHFLGQSGGFYFQDDWKVHPRLTLNFGARYELPLPYYDKQDRMASFQPGRQSTVRPDAPSGLLFPGDPGVPRATIQTDRNNFAPRLGLAWDMSGDGLTSLRAGYGLAFDSVPGVGAFQNINVPPFNRFVQLDVPPSFANPYGHLPSNPQTDPARNFPCPCLVIGFSPDFRTPYAQNVSLGVQRQLARNLMFEAGYVGTFGTKLPGYLEINPAVPGAGATLQNSQARRLYRDFNLIRPTFSQFNSNYHALQLRAERRYANGLQFTMNYTWSKAIDFQSSLNFSGENRPQDAFSLKDVRGLAAFDVRHRFVTSFGYELPFLRGNRGVAGALLGGWLLSGVVSAQSGGPLTVNEPIDLSLRALGADRPDQISDPNNGPRTVQRWFDTSAFQRLGPLAGGQRLGTAGRNTVIGPGLVQTDLALLKQFRLFESHRLEVRGEFFNALNRSNFRDPGTNSGQAATFGVIQTSRPARVIQIGLKYAF